MKENPLLLKDLLKPKLTKFKYAKHLEKSNKLSIDKLDNIVNKCNSTCHSTIQIKLDNVKLNIYLDFNKENNKEDSKFEVGDHVRILKFNNIFAKGYTSNWSQGFVVKKVQNTMPWAYVRRDLNGEEIEKGIAKNKSKIVQY